MSLEQPVERRQPGGAPWLRFGVAAALFGYLVTSDAIDWASFGGFADQPRLVAAAFGCLVLTVLLTVMRLPLLMRAQGFQLRPLAAVQLGLMGMFFGLFLPGSASGDAAKIYYAVSGQQRGTRAELATVVLFDRAVAMWAMFGLPLMAIPFFPGLLDAHPALRTMLWLCTAVSAAGGLALGAVLYAPEQNLRHIPWALLTRSLVTVRGYRHHLPVVFAVFGLSILAHASAVGVTALVAAAIEPASLRPELALVVPLGFVANALPLTPGGLGVGEVAFHRLFELVGMSGGAEVAVGWRLGIISISLLGGLLYLRGFRTAIQRINEPADGDLMAMDADR